MQKQMMQLRRTWNGSFFEAIFLIRSFGTIVGDGAVYIDRRASVELVFEQGTERAKDVFHCSRDSRRMGSRGNS